MLLSNRVVRDHSCGGMIYYENEWHEEVLGNEESMGRVAPIDL